jgi:hypothetical protein
MGASNFPDAPLPLPGRAARLTRSHLEPAKHPFHLVAPFIPLFVILPRVFPVLFRGETTGRVSKKYRNNIMKTVKYRHGGIWDLSAEKIAIK